jgi:eukaryotic-like serine/threonine-protein kinase
MALSAGSRIGPYEIVEAIGAGGMGEVYRARDAKLARDVALKVLPAEFALDPDRLARLTREAQVLASLNHQNIAGIYGFEEGSADVVSGFSRTIHALVLEYVDGPTLAARIAQGPIPVDEALPIARQIAEALEAAHEHGIIHRDLKPANIKVRPDGTVKVLDFGLAKLAQGPGPRPQASVSALTVSPTITTPAMTQIGVILGTAAYMSPEQAKGREADKRSDLWAFGCVLYEMLTGRRVFDGDDVSDTLAFVLTKQADFKALPAATPGAIRTLLRRCLERDRKRRLADAADARLETEDALASHEGQSAPGEQRASARASLWRSIAIGAGALVVGGLIVGLTMWSRQTPVPAPVIARFALPLADGQRFMENGNQVLAISPDGSHVAFASDRRLYLRSLSEFEAKPIPGTEIPVGQVSSPMFSPDGQSIAYVSGRPASLKRIPVSGGASVTICEGCGSLGVMSWGPGGIVFAQGGAGMPPGFAGERASKGPNRIMRVAADGGEPQLLFNVTDGTPWDVQVLPDGETILFGLVKNMMEIVSGRQTGVEGQVIAQVVKTGQRKVVVANGTAPRYLPTGHILYAREGMLFARRFDLQQLETVGSEIAVVSGVRRAGFVGGATSAAYFGISESGSLAYVPGPVSRLVQYDLGRLDPQKGVEPLKLPPNTYQFPRVSPDGKWIAVETNDGSSENIWIYERSGASAVRQLTSKGRNRYPIWSPDSASVTFQSDRDGDAGLYVQRADGARPAERLTKAEAGTSHVPDSWSPDGKTLLFEIDDEKKSTRHLWAWSGGTTRTADVDERGSKASFIQATFSPNGRWIAYRSISIASTPAVSVQPFPPTGAIFPIYETAVHPVWSRDGKTLYFNRMSSNEMYAVPVTTESAFSFGKPQRLPVTFPDQESNSAPRNHDITPDGKFIGVVSVSGETNARPQINLVMNWFEELKQRVPAK